MVSLPLRTESELLRLTSNLGFSCLGFPNSWDYGGYHYAHLATTLGRSDIHQTAFICPC